MKSVLKKRYDYFKVGGGHFEMVIDLIRKISRRRLDYFKPL